MVSEFYVSRRVDRRVALISGHHSIGVGRVHGISRLGRFLLCAVHLFLIEVRSGAYLGFLQGY